MDDAERPQASLAQRVLPKGLLAALSFILTKTGANTMLVGGTALSGFYAGHRSSDDLDLFCASSEAMQVASKNIKLFTECGARLTSELTTPGYSKWTATYQEHSFTIDLVLDPWIFHVGKCHPVILEKSDEVIFVASLLTILKMKSATLVSRASEKDLYDLLWILSRYPDLTLQELIELGQQVDGGVNGEAILISLGSTTISENACGFTSAIANEKKSAEEVFDRISRFKSHLEKELSLFLHQDRKVSPLGEIVRAMKKLAP